LVRHYAAGIDLPAVRDLVGIRDHELTAVARALSVAGSAYVTLPLALLCAAALLLSGRRALGLLIGLGTFGAVIIENFDKLLVGRPRPPVHHLELVTSWSFPSGHATQSTAFYGSLAIALVMLFPGRRVLRVLIGAITVLLVCAISFSRIYLGVHYPTDVAAGMALSSAWIMLLTQVLKSSDARLVPRRFPRPG
jgi:undecaprenyl-diphosphatase